MSTVKVELVFTDIEEATAFFAGNRRVSAQAKSIAVTENVATAETKTKKETIRPKTEQPPESPDAKTALVIERVTVSQATVKLATKDRERAVAILAEFGVTSVKSLPDEHLVALHAKVIAALEELA